MASFDEISCGFAKHRGLHRGLHRGPWEFPGISGNFRDFYGIFLIFGQILRFVIKITCFLSFSSKNDAESFRHFIKNLVLVPKRAKLVQKSLRKVYGKYTESSKTSKTCPGRPIWAHKGPYVPIWVHIIPFNEILIDFGIARRDLYGPIWALIGLAGQVLEVLEDSVNFQ